MPPAIGIRSHPDYLLLRDEEKSPDEFKLIWKTRSVPPPAGVPFPPSAVHLIQIGEGRHHGKGSVTLEIYDKYNCDAHRQAAAELAHAVYALSDAAK